MRSKGLTATAVCAALAICAVTAASSSAKTVWLCRPGQRPDPCTPGLSTTVYTPTLKQVRVDHPKRVRTPAIDCFYVYPTVSGQKTGNANLRVDPEERSIALQQIARYSQYCDVYTPMYRQITIAGVGDGTPTTKPNPALALADLENAFQTYLKKYNHGRGFVLIGHSQGADMLRLLMANKVDRNPSVRRRLVSAILIGGNVLVKKGRNIGGDFQHIAGCTKPRQIGCVIAFSTFDQPVPTPTLFGRPIAFLGTKISPGTGVLCTNPAALGGGSGILNPIFPSQPFYPKSGLAVGIALTGLRLPQPPTVFVTEPGAYRASCSSANNANVLQITPVRGAQTLKPSPTPEWGLHLLDANIALGNLIGVVKTQTAAFVARVRGARS
jgi:Protein of unknown function (DUF3089)